MGSRLSDLGNNTNNMSESTTTVLDGLSKNAYERRINRLEDEKKELARRLNDSNKALQKFAHGAPIETEEEQEQPNNNHVEKMQEEINEYKKRNSGSFHLIIKLKG